jgi:hypothetical protein
MVSQRAIDLSPVNLLHSEKGTRYNTLQVSADYGGPTAASILPPAA